MPDIYIKILFLITLNGLHSQNDFINKSFFPLSVLTIMTDSVSRHSIPSSMMCLLSSSPCPHLTDWPVSEMMWCFSSIFTRDGTCTNLTVYRFLSCFQISELKKNSLSLCSPSLGSTQWTKPE